MAQFPAPNGKAAASADPGKPQEVNPEVLKKVAAVRAQVRESFGKIAMAMMALPR